MYLNTWRRSRDSDPRVALLRTIRFPIGALKPLRQISLSDLGGDGAIRTLEPALNRPPDFESGALDLSATSPVELAARMGYDPMASVLTGRRATRLR